MRHTHTRPVWSVIAALAVMLGMMGALVPTATAQDSIIPVNAPVDIHSGTCDDFLTEPAYDGGAITPTTLEEVRDDEAFGAGILDDDEAGVTGVDLDDDDAIGDDEVIAPIDEDAEIGFAEADIEPGVDATEPYIVALHAGPEQYETILACGSINAVEELDEDRLVVPLQPVDDSQLFGYSVIEDDGASIRTYIFQRGTAPEAAVVEGIAGYPVDIHSGTCADWVEEPAYDVGDMLETNVAAPGEQDRKSVV